MVFNLKQKLTSFITLGIVCKITNAQITVSNTSSQAIHGIGASGAWWPNDLINFPDSAREEAAELLFGNSGIGITSYRYNIGGGGVFVGTPARAPQTFYVSNGVYNWSADAAGVYFLQKAAQANVPIITAFINSAPPAFTSNGKSCGGSIVDSQVPAYAKYIADVISHWKSEGVAFTHVSPMNEPDNGFGGSNGGECGQEGMIVTPQQRAEVVNAVRSALDAAGLQSVGIMADESSQAASVFIPEAPIWIPSARGSLAAVSHHQYGFASDAVVAQMGALGRNLSGQDTWFSEICCWGPANAADAGNPAAPLTYAQGFDPTMIGALQLGKIIHQSFTQALDAHFDFWTALSSGIGCSPIGNDGCTTIANKNGWNDGFIYYDPDYNTNNNFALYTTKRFFLFKHFANFVWLGAARFDVGNLPSNVFGLAFKASRIQQTALGHARASLVLMNMGTSSSTVDLSRVDLGQLIGVVQTSASVDWQIQGTNGTTITLPAMSINTFLFL